MKKVLLIVAVIAFFAMAFASCSSKGVYCPAYIDKVDHPKPAKPA